MSVEADRNARLELLANGAMVLSLAVFMGTARATFGVAADTVVECAEYGTAEYDGRNSTPGCDRAYGTIDDEATYDAAAGSSECEAAFFVIISN